MPKQCGRRLCSQQKRLQTLMSVTSLLSPIEKDYGRVVDVSTTEDMDLVLLAYNEQQCLDTLRYGSGQEQGSIPASLVKLADVEQNTYSKFLPSLKPFIPRQRLLYLIMRGENSTCYLYNYTNEVVAKTKEVVERAILWHNARSRLLREIGLHKMGITHLSTLGAQVNNAKNPDSKFNSYLLLTWMDPETLVRNDYPVDNLTTPDFSKIPRLYAQLLLKLYRFSDPRLWPKILVKVPSMTKLSRCWHCERIGDAALSEENFARIIHRSHQDHFVQSPILLGLSQAQLSSLNHLSTTRTSPKIRSKTINASYLAGGAAANFRSLDEELLLRIQHMLMDEYVKYLQHKLIGLTHIKLE
uniref:Uncharacterized protein n=1 Tax=Ditylenchus dipsaci TaxID=166011 RepID=A0A915DS17_9BILA